MSVGKFVKKPVVIDAMKYTGHNLLDVITWLSANGKDFVHKDGVLAISTLEGNMEVSVGDWVIRGVQGEFYPCKPDIFIQCYDPYIPS